MMQSLCPALALLCLFVCPGITAAAERYAVIVSGPAGGERFAVLQQTWRETLTSALVDRLGFVEANVRVLDHEASGAGRATRDNVSATLAGLRIRTRPDDLLMLVLLGHSSIDGTDGKFNLVGPDLTAAEWSAALNGIAARIVVVNTTEASFPFLADLSRRGRVVITATDSAVQRYATVFAEYFVRAIVDADNDDDLDGRISVWELFAGTSAAVKRYYEQRGQLSTERALLDDDGDARGREAAGDGSDGALARTLFLDGHGRAEGPSSPTAAALAVERRVIEGQLDELRLRRPLMGEAVYSVQLEALLVRLARITRRLQSLSSDR